MQNKTSFKDIFIAAFLTFMMVSPHAHAIDFPNLGFRNEDVNQQQVGNAYPDFEVQSYRIMTRGLPGRYLREYQERQEVRLMITAKTPRLFDVREVSYHVFMDQIEVGNGMMRFGDSMEGGYYYASERVDVTLPHAGDREVYIVLDLDDEVPESDETNNALTEMIHVMGENEDAGFDFEIKRSSLHPMSPEDAENGEYLGAYVANEPVVLKVEVSANGLLRDNRRVEPIGHRVSESIRYEVLLDGEVWDRGRISFTDELSDGRQTGFTYAEGVLPGGEHELSVVIDTRDSYEEVNEINNTLSRNITIENVDLELHESSLNIQGPQGGLGLNKIRPNEEVVMVISASANGQLSRGGPLAAIARSVHYDVSLNGEVWDSGVLLFRDELENGRQSAFSFAGGVFPAGQHELTVVLDPENNIPEGDEGNNRLSRNISVGNIDLNLHETSVNFYESFGGEPIQEIRSNTSVGMVISASADGELSGGGGVFGGALSRMVDYRVLLNGESWESGRLMFNNELEEGMQSAFTFVQGSLPAGDHEVTVVLDPNNRVTESNENNNRRSRNVRVENLDLVLSESTLNLVGAFGTAEEGEVIEEFRTDVPVMMTVVATADGFLSAGGENAVFQRMVRYAVELDGDVIESGNLFFPDELEDGVQITATFLELALPQGQHQLSVTLDPSNSVEERNENNNRVSRNIFVSGAPVERIEPEEQVGLPQNIGAQAGAFGAVAMGELRGDYRFAEGNGQIIGNPENYRQGVIEEVNIREDVSIVVQVVADHDEMPEAVPYTVALGDFQLHRGAMRFNQQDANGLWQGRAAIPYRFAQGDYTISITLDPENEIVEGREDNNVFERGIRVWGGRERDDVWLTDATGNIRGGAGHPRGQVLLEEVGAREPIQILVQAETDNFDGIRGVDYAVFDGNFEIERGTIWFQMPNEQGGSSYLISVDTELSFGDHGIRIVLDPDQEIPESNEENNVVERMVRVRDTGLAENPNQDGFNLWLENGYYPIWHDGPVNGTNDYFLVGQTMRAGYVVKASDLSFGETPLRLRAFMNNDLVRQARYNGLLEENRRGEFEYRSNVSYTFDAPGFYTLQVHLDPENRIEESDELDNRATKTFEVRAEPGADWNYSDLTVATTERFLLRYPDDMNAAPEVLVIGEPYLIRGIVHVDNQQYVGRYAVIGFELNGQQIRMEEPVQIQLGYNGRGFMEAEVPVTFDRAGSHTIRIIADPENEFRESNENNNVKTFEVQVAPGNNVMPRDGLGGVPVGDIDLNKLDLFVGQNAGEILQEGEGGVLEVADPPFMDEDLAIRVVGANTRADIVENVIYAVYVGDREVARGNLNFNPNDGGQVALAEDLARFQFSDNALQRVRIVIDPDNDFEESLENNNEREFQVVVESRKKDEANRGEQAEARDPGDKQPEKKEPKKRSFFSKLFKNESVDKESKKKMRGVSLSPAEEQELMQIKKSVPDAFLETLARETLSELAESYQRENVNGVMSKISADFISDDGKRYADFSKSIRTDFEEFSGIDLSLKSIKNVNVQPSNSWIVSMTVDWARSADVEVEGRRKRWVYEGRSELSFHVSADPNQIQNALGQEPVPNYRQIPWVVELERLRGDDLFAATDLQGALMVVPGKSGKRSTLNGKRVKTPQFVGETGANSNQQVVSEPIPNGMGELFATPIEHRGFNFVSGNEEVFFLPAPPKGDVYIEQATGDMKANGSARIVQIPSANSGNFDAYTKDRNPSQTTVTPLNGAVYLVKTRSNTYAKFLITDLGFDGITFDTKITFAHQPDGSGDLVSEG